MTGIGRSITKIEQIAALQRPITMEDGGMVLMDLLWSDPTTNDGVEGVQPSPRGPGLVTFGPDRVKEFCKVAVLSVRVTCTLAASGMTARCSLPCCTCNTHFCSQQHDCQAVYWFAGAVGCSSLSS